MREPLGYDSILLSIAIPNWLRTMPLVDRPDDYPRGNHVREFAKAVGLAEYLKTNPNKILDTHSPEVQRILDLLNGPHGHTIMQTLIIRNKYASSATD